MSETTARVTPRPEQRDEPRFTQNVTILLEQHVRAFILGTRAEEGAQSEGAVVRALLESSIEFYRGEHPAEYAKRIRRGEEILALRAGAV